MWYNKNVKILSYFKRFLLWMLSWVVLVILNGIFDEFILGAGSHGEEYLGPAMLLAFPIFLVVGIADEIRYRIKSRNKETS